MFLDSGVAISGKLMELFDQHNPGSPICIAVAFWGEGAAEFLNNKLKEIRDRGSIIGSERIAIMAALNLAHELLNSQEYKNSFNDIDSRVSNLQSKIDIALREIEVT